MQVGPLEPSSWWNRKPSGAPNAEVPVRVGARARILGPVRIWEARRLSTAQGGFDSRPDRNETCARIARFDGEAVGTEHCPASRASRVRLPLSPLTWLRTPTSGRGTTSRTCSVSVRIRSQLPRQGIPTSRGRRLRPGVLQVQLLSLAQRTYARVAQRKCSRMISGRREVRLLPRARTP